MLEKLHIRNYVLIDALETEFPEGLVIITGQTGAGKSILVGALTLLLGGKGDASMVGPHGDNCVVEGEFTLPEDPAVRAWLEENGLEAEGDRLVIRRVLSRSGRSRSFLCDLPVTVAQLSWLSARLVDIHSQHQTLMLSDARFQLSLLDAFAGNEARLAEVAACWRGLTQILSEKAEVERRIQTAAQDREYREARLRKLEEARLQEGEQEALEEEQQRLAHAEEIKELLSAVTGRLEPPDGESESLPSALGNAARGLERLSAWLPEAAGFGQRLHSARIEVEDILSELQRLDEGVEVSPQRLQQVEERLSVLYGLQSRFSCQSVAELIALRDSLARELDGDSNLQEWLEELTRAAEQARGAWEVSARALHQEREQAAAPFAAAIEKALHELELDRAVFKVSLEEGEGGAGGMDTVRFLFSSTGRDPVDVARCASGGELSRIMLCLKEMMARHREMPTMIFDEIDSGVSGSVADRMGSMICRMGAHMQIFAITHLPQVAAKGHAHYLVTKSTDPASGDVVSELLPLQGEDRVMEIARMLSGASLTPEAVANARRLLSA